MDSLKSQGYTIQPVRGLKKKEKRIYYRPETGAPTCPLPADPYHVRVFLKGGLLLEPPGEVVPAEPKRKYKHTRKFLKKQAQGKS